MLLFLIAAPITPIIIYNNVRQDSTNKSNTLIINIFIIKNKNVSKTFIFKIHKIYSHIITIRLFRY